MHKLYELKDKVLNELGDYADHSKFSKDDIESIKYMASAVDHLCNVIDRCEEEYSMDMGGSYNMGGSYESGRIYPRGSFARGGGRGGNRGGRGGRTGANQYGSYDDGTEMIIRELRELMNDAPNEQTKMEFKKFIQKMEQM